LSIQVDGMIDYLHGIYEPVNKTVNDSNTKYKVPTNTHHRRVVFEVVDIVWTMLIHDRFLMREYNKMKERKISS
jgi:hypothetical protein